MRKTIVVAMREYQAAVRTKAFIVSLVAMPVLMGGSILVTQTLKDRVDTGDKQIAVLDRSGLLLEGLQAAAAERNAKDIFAREGGKRIAPRYLLEGADFGTDSPTQEQLAEKCGEIRAGKLFALVVIGPDVQRVDDIPPTTQTAKGFKSGGTIDVYSDATSFDEFNQWLRGKVNEIVHERRFAEAGLPKEKIDRALTYVPVEPRKPLQIDAATGEVEGGARKTEGADVMVPVITMFLMFMVITVGALPLMNSVLEEKMQRIAEVLLGSVQPFELMAGKLLGMVGVSMTILAVYLGGAVLGMRNAGLGEFIPPNLTSLVIWFVVFQALAVLMFGALFVAIGAACSDMKEAQSMLMPVWIVICIPMFVWFVVVREPASTFSTVLSLVPPATPMLMMLRTAAMPNIPLWQPLLGVVLVLLTTVFCIFVAGRIFRVGILMQGKGAKFTEMVRWALRG